MRLTCPFLLLLTLSGTPTYAQSSTQLPHEERSAASDTDLLLEMADEGLKARQYRQVARLCEFILKKDTLNKEAHLLLGIANHYLGEYDQAVENLRWVLLLDSNNAIATEYFHRSKEKSLSRWSPQEVGLLKTAMLYYAEGLNGLTISTLKEVLKHNPQNSQALELIGDTYRKLGNIATAKAAYHEANTQEKASKIEGEVRSIPKDWWETIDEKEAQLYEADLLFAKIRDEIVQIRGTLSDFDARTRDYLNWQRIELKQQSEEESKEVTERTIENMDEEGRPIGRPRIVRTEKRLFLPKKEVDGHLAQQSEQFDKERSKITERLEHLYEKLNEVESQRKRLEEVLRYESFE